ncbi:hypothetical protein TNIN_40411 [Trichonephila inaurata madagascariensis]|uniref:Uncharacterized protein n=1 Tax=Trichonephila inaurata madagascariensis TaxID=2747483 RepID=A0A8X6XCT5_9ARAC|nr:hypothetical protein TNIN_40411 [Trichonephila inaurata madagascariensis]
MTPALIKSGTFKRSSREEDANFDRPNVYSSLCRNGLTPLPLRHIRVSSALYRLGGEHNFRGRKLHATDERRILFALLEKCGLENC